VYEVTLAQLMNPVVIPAAEVDEVVTKFCIWAVVISFPAAPGISVA
jgi:hypothetical protein